MSGPFQVYRLHLSAVVFITRSIYTKDCLYSIHSVSECGVVDSVAETAAAVVVAVADDG